MIHFKFQNKFFHPGSSVNQVSPNHHGLTHAPTARLRPPGLGSEKRVSFKTRGATFAGTELPLEPGCQATPRFSVRAFSLRI